MGDNFDGLAELSFGLPHFVEHVVDQIKFLGDEFAFDDLLAEECFGLRSAEHYFYTVLFCDSYYIAYNV